MKKDKILITGGNGYIGFNLYTFLKKKGYKIILLDNLSAGANKRKRINLKKISCTDKAKVEKLILKENIKHIFHLAGHISVNDNNKKKNYENNFLSTTILIELSKKYSLKSFIFSSTSAVYKNSKIKNKENSKLLPISNYGKFKLKSEKLIKKKFKGNYAILRLFNVGGATKIGGGPTNSKANSIIKVLVNAKIKKKPLNINIIKRNKKIYYPVRDFINISDVIKALYRSFIYINKHHKNMIFNCGSSKPISLLYLIKKFENHFNYKFNKNYRILNKKEILYSVSCNNLIKRTLNIKIEKSSLIKILKSSYGWFYEK